MVDLNKLAAEIHEAAVKKGFWSVEDAEEKHLAKMISELGEVVQADRAGIMYEVEHEGAKPEGVVAELADFVMMAIDLVVNKRSNDMLFGKRMPRTNIPDYKSMHAYELVCRLNEFAATLSHVFEKDTIEWLIAREGIKGQTGELIRGMIWDAIDDVDGWIHVRGFDLWEIIRQKMAYNESRPALHGRLY